MAVQLIVKRQDSSGDSSADQVKRLDLEAPGEITLQLDAGTWLFQAKAEGFWSKATTLAVSGPDNLVRLELWPTGSLAGKVLIPRDEELPEDLHIYFQSIPSANSREAVPDGKVTCPVKDLGWRCALPAATLDLQLLAIGFIRDFQWDVEVKAGEIVRLGTITLRRGSAIRGWIVTEDGAPAKKTLIELAPRIAGQRRDPTARARTKNLTLSTTANHRGFFQLDAVAPGDYVVTANKEPYGPAQDTVRVFENQITEISNPPLILRYPQTLEVYVDPPTMRLFRSLCG